MSTYEEIIAERAMLKGVKDSINGVMPCLDNIVVVKQNYQRKIDKQYVATGFDTKVLEILDSKMSLRDGAKFKTTDKGVLVTEVSEDSKMGLEVKPGYLITEVAGVGCESVEKFHTLLDELDGKEEEFVVKVKVAKPKTLASYLKVEGLEMKEPTDLDHDAFEKWVKVNRDPELVRDKGLKKWTAERDAKIGELELSIGAINDSSLKQDIEDLIKRLRGEFDRQKLGNFNFEVKKVTTTIFRKETELLKQAKDVKAERKDNG